MKQYVVDEIRPADYEKIKAYLDAEFGPAEMGGIYWVPVAQKMRVRPKKIEPGREYSANGNEDHCEPMAIIRPG